MSRASRKICVSVGTFWIALMGLQGCLGSSNSPNSMPKTLADKAVTVLDYSYNNGSVSPDYHYNVSFKVDFQAASIVTSVTKGSSVTDILPSAGTKSLNDQQLAEIRALFNEISVVSCPSGVPSVGGGITKIDVYTSSSSNVDSTIFTTDCTGMTDPGSYQATAAAAQSFTDYIKGL